MGGKNHGWILDGNDDRGWVLYLDWKRNGDLSGARPQRFNRVNGVYQLQEEVIDGDVQWPCRFEVTHVKVKGVEQPAVFEHDQTVRRGVIEVGGKRAPFTLMGENGRYNEAFQSFTVDRTGAGRPENYSIAERYLNLFGKSYEFKVNARGDSLALTELPVARPDRPPLTVGSAAPEFAATDTGDVRRNLAGYRGRLVLLEFWGTWCVPCERDAPRLVKFYKNTPRDKVELLGVSTDDSQATLRRFLTTSGIQWPQIRESVDGTLHRLYRANGLPTYYVIGPTGAILETWVGGDKLARLSKYLAQR
jgi:thiol-disulfide isomerase/thioredoxin